MFSRYFITVLFLLPWVSFSFGFPGAPAKAKKKKIAVVSHSGDQPDFDPTSQGATSVFRKKTVIVPANALGIPQGVAMAEIYRFKITAIGGAARPRFGRFNVNASGFLFGESDWIIRPVDEDGNIDWVTPNIGRVDNFHPDDCSTPVSLARLFPKFQKGAKVPAGETREFTILVSNTIDDGNGNSDDDKVVVTWHRVTFNQVHAYRGLPKSKGFVKAKLWEEGGKVARIVKLKVDPITVIDEN